MTSGAAMPSPFPGMDPYLEDPAGWGGVHLGLLYAIHAQLNDVLPDGFVAELDQYVWTREEPDDDSARLGKPDVLVPKRRPFRAGSRSAAAVATVPPTVLTRLPKQEVRTHRRVKITTDRGARVVTVVEVLSPSNKSAGDDRDVYLNKRREYFAARANVVEIDLLRAGHRLPMGHPDPPAADYYVFVSPANRLPNAQVWVFTVRDPIPVFAVPLTRDVPAIPLDLRRCLDRVYDDGRYPEKLDYAGRPVPPLRSPNAEWAAELLEKTAKRKK